MYVLTYYSFKGGVGRTMALVNNALELALSGQRVLLVDFDLEATGIETFDLLKPRHDSPGLVDFITDYVTTGRAPDVRDYTYRVSSLVGKDVDIWIMPSGRRDALYGSRFNDIDWQDLYSRRDGYLLFEDLKAQWSTTFSPHYVLIDSRTGHTDVGGICTRQLPDAVVVLFFPNEQNLLGLAKVVEDVRAESTRQQRDIVLHFVTSNIPDLDDEDQILAERMSRFKKQLGIVGLAGSIHHYSSLALLNQVVFAVERPRSRLAREYSALLDIIRRANAQDRYGALRFLKLFTTTRRSGGAKESEQASTAQFKDIEEAHSADGEVLYALSRAYEEIGDIAKTRDLMSAAEEAGYASAELYIRRAYFSRWETGATSKRSVPADLRKALRSADAVPTDFRYAIRLLRESDPRGLAGLERTANFRSFGLADKVSIVAELLYPRTHAIAARVLDAIIPEPFGEVYSLIDESTRNELALGLIACGRFELAMRSLATDRRSLSRDIRTVFNYAMAEWGATRVPPADLFATCVQLEPPRAEVVDSANMSLCLAIAHHWAGDVEGAKELVTAARPCGHGDEAGESEFSPWRYLTVSRQTFRKDAERVSALINGTSVVPLFFSAGRRLHVTS